MDKHQAVLNKAHDKQNSTEKKKLEEEKELLYQECKKKDKEVQSVYNKFLEEKKQSVIVTCSKKRKTLYSSKNTAFSATPRGSLLPLGGLTCYP